MICPCCETDQKQFDTYRGRINAACPVCGALERHRLIWLYLEQEMAIYDNELRILHCSPQETLRRKLREIENLYYVPINIFGRLLNIDLVEVPFRDSFFDVVIASHVLEHIGDDKRALGEIFRVLKSDGNAILLVPMRGEQTRDIQEGEHGVSSGTLRIYGEDFGKQLEEIGFTDIEVIGHERYSPKYGLHIRDKIYIGRKRK